MIRTIDKILKLYVLGVAFPLGDTPRSFSEEETQMMRTLSEQFSIFDGAAPDVRAFRTLLDSQERAYNWVIFSLRMGLYAVQTGDSSLLLPSIWGLCLDDDLVDWRDVLIGLSLSAKCAELLHMDFPLIAARFAQEWATERRRSTIETGFLARSAAMRRPEVFGFAWDEVHHDFVSTW